MERGPVPTADDPHRLRGHDERQGQEGNGLPAHAGQRAHHRQLPEPAVPPRRGLLPDGTCHSEPGPRPGLPAWPPGLALLHPGGSQRGRALLRVALPMRPTARMWVWRAGEGSWRLMGAQGTPPLLPRTCPQGPGVTQAWGQLVSPCEEGAQSVCKTAGVTPAQAPLCSILVISLQRRLSFSEHPQFTDASDVVSSGNSGRSWAGLCGSCPLRAWGACEGGGCDGSPCPGNSRAQFSACAPRHEHPVSIQHRTGSVGIEGLSRTVGKLF